MSNIETIINNALKKHLSNDVISIIVEFVGFVVRFQRNKSRELKNLGVIMYNPVYKITLKIPIENTIVFHGTYNEPPYTIPLNDTIKKVIRDIENEAKKDIPVHIVTSIYDYRYNYGNYGTGIQVINESQKRIKCKDFVTIELIHVIIKYSFGYFKWVVRE